MSLRAHTLLLPLVLLLAACASEGPPPLPDPAVSPTGEPWPWPVVPSADGRFQLRMGPTRWNDDAAAPGGFTLSTQATVEGLDADTLLGGGNPLAEVRLPGGGLVDPGKGYGSADSRWGNIFLNGLPVDPAARILPLLAFEVPILRVRTWETHTFTGIGVEGVEDLPAPPFLLSVSGDGEICHVGAYLRGETGGVAPTVRELASLLGHGWAAMGATVTDASGRTLECCGGNGDGGFTDGMYVVNVPGAGGVEEEPIAWPVTVELRIPREYAVETVRFEVRDLELPEPPEPLPRAVPVIEEVDRQERDPRDIPHDAAWSEWTKPAQGLSARFSFQKRTPRGERLSSGLALKFDPAGLPEGVTHFDPFGVERGVRLVLRSAERGTTVEIPAVDPQEGGPTPPRTGEEEWEPKPLPLGPGAATEMQLWFPLAAAWERLLPGTWEARLAVSVEAHPENPPPHAAGTPAPVPWTGTFSTGPVRVIVEEAPLRSLRVRVPTRLRMVPWAEVGAGVAVGCLEEDREPLEVLARNGFTLGIEVRVEGMVKGVSEGSSPRLDFVDSLPHDHEGPFAANYTIEIYETGEEFRYHVPHARDHPTFRSLWKREFRVEGMEEEIEALQR